MKRKLLSVVLLFFATLNSNAITFNESLLFSVSMDGNHLVPSVTTDAHSLGSFILNKTRDSVSVNLSVVGLNSNLTGIMLKSGSAGANGTLVMDLTPYVNGNQLSMVLTGTIVTSNISNYFAENLYLVATTVSNPGGEIGGQIKMVSDELFVADLSGTNTVPVVTGPAYGLASFRLSYDHSKIDYKILCQNLSGSITAATINLGSAGSTGPVSEDISTSVAGNTITGSFVATPTLLTGLLTGDVYLNIATALNPAGEVRSQLVRYKGLVFDGWATGAQLIPSVSGNAKALCVIRFSPAMDTLYYDAVVDNVTSSIDYAHLHVGDYGMQYSTLQVDFTPSIIGHRIKGIKTGLAIASSTIRRLLISNLSIVVHTTNYPNGEVRGQIVRFAHDGYTFNIDGAQVVSPVNTTGYGSGIASINRDEDIAHYAYVVGGLSASATGAHLNNAVSGQNGPVINDITSNAVSTGNYVVSSEYWKGTDAIPFVSANSLQFASNAVYMEIVNSNYSGGEVRGQIRKGFVTYATTPVADVPNQSHEWVIGPVPASDFITISNAGLKQGNVNLFLMDALGRVCMTKSLDSDNGIVATTFDVSDLLPGVYCMMINAEGGSFSSKVIIK